MLLRKGWQLYEVTRGHRLQRLPCFLPRRYPPNDDERIEALFSQLQRHPGAGGFAGSSTVEVDVLVFGNGLEFLGKIVGFDADGSLDAFRPGIIVAVTADVEDQNFVFFV